jgi:hypothetical protein
MIKYRHYRVNNKFNYFFNNFWRRNIKNNKWIFKIVMLRRRMWGKLEINCRPFRLIMMLIRWIISIIIFIILEKRIVTFIGQNKRKFRKIRKKLSLIIKNLSISLRIQ